MQANTFQQRRDLPYRFAIVLSSAFVQLFPGYQVRMQFLLIIAGRTVLPAVEKSFGHPTPVFDSTENLYVVISEFIRLAGLLV